MLIKYRKFIDKGLIELNIHKKTEKRLIEEQKDLLNQISVLRSTREIFQKATILTQNFLAKHISDIVTKSLRTVFHEKSISFHVKFVERRNVSECDMWIEEKGYKYIIMGSRGYGIVDIISLTLRISYVLLHNSDNILIIDEPCRNLSRNKHGVMSKLLNSLSHELGIQFIMATHSDDFINHSDTAYFIEQDDDGISRIKKVH